MRTTLLILLTLCPISGRFLFAQVSTRDIDKEKAIETHLSKIAPSMVEIFHAATIAMDEGKLQLADSLYTIVYQQVPDFDPVLRRLGMIRGELGKYKEAIGLCQKAVSINRSAYNLLSLASCMYMDQEEATMNTDSLYVALSLVKEAETLPHGNDADFPSLKAQIALMLGEVTEFRTATTQLQNKHPDEMATHYFLAILAANDGEWSKAEKEILIAQKLGLSEDAVEAFLDSGVRSKTRINLYIWIFIGIVVVWIGGLLLLFLTGKLLSNSVMKSVNRNHGQTEASDSEKRIKSIYKSLINIGGVYYYISLPIILILTIALTAGLVYLGLVAGFIPIKILLILLVGAVITIIGMVRSLFIKLNYSDPGRALNEAEAPALFGLAREVANTIRTRPIDEIRITPGTDLAVYERGTWKEKMKDKAQRILILGVGVLSEFKLNEFKAVLAHEYGHFSNRDTAGGDVAMRVNGDMHKYLIALYKSGQTVWWNMAFQFLRLYHFLFRRISHGATRLQEILADRVAAQTYGALSFQNGLTYVIKRDIEFSKYASAEIEEAKSTKRSFNNLYELTGTHNEDIETELQAQLNRPTSEDDTHPSPVDRFRYVQGISAVEVSPDHRSVKDLFVDWEKLTMEMTTQIEEQVKAGGEE